MADSDHPDAEQQSYQNLMQTCGIGHLVAMLQNYLDRMMQQDKVVEAYLNEQGTLDDEVVDDLRRAKAKSMKMEIEILLSIMNNIGEMVQFLDSIILIENTFNAIYKPLREQQQSARRQMATNIAQLETAVARPMSDDVSFAALVNGCNNHYLQSFKRFIDGFIPKVKSKYKLCTGSKSKGIERAFYKTFYGYNGDYKRMLDMMRCSFVFETFEELYSAFTLFEEYCADKCDGGILRVKDRFEPEQIAFGYRDLMVNIKAPNTSVICEIQFHLFAFYQHKKVSHKMYKKARLFENGDLNDAYSYAQMHARPNLGDKTILEQKSSASDSDDEEDGAGFGCLKAADLNSVKQFASKTIDDFKSKGWSPMHVEYFMKHIGTYLKKFKSSWTDPSLIGVNMKLYCTELDDVESYENAERNTIDKFEWGVRIGIKKDPAQKSNFCYNFRCFCKYGLNSFIADYIEEATKDYKQILGDLMAENDDKGSAKDSIYDPAVIDIITGYLSHDFPSIQELLSTTNQYKESGMILAAKYGQSATVEILIKYSKKYKISRQVINHKANGGTPLFMIFKCYNRAVFKFLDKIAAVRPTMMLLLMNGAEVSPAFSFDKQQRNVAELAQIRGKILEAKILRAFFMTQQGTATSPMQYAQQRKDQELMDILKLYRIE